MDGNPHTFEFDTLEVDSLLCREVLKSGFVGELPSQKADPPYTSSSTG